MAGVTSETRQHMLIDQEAMARAGRGLGLVRQGPDEGKTCSRDNDDRDKDDLEPEQPWAAGISISCRHVRLSTDHAPVTYPKRA